MTDVVCIGECMVEFCPRPDGSYELGFAGDAFNAAAYLKRSAPDINVHFLTATGADRFSAAMRAAWRTESLADDLAFTVNGANPGLYVISVDKTGERSFSYWRSASPARRWLELLREHGGLDRLAHVDLIYLSGITLAILPADQQAEALAFLKALRERGRKIAFDPNYRAPLWPSQNAAQQVLGAAMRIADIVLPSQDDLTATGLKAPEDVECVTTCGADGCWIVTPSGKTFLQAPAVPPSAMRDTAGAGDSFTGTYLAARLKGSAPVDAAKLALTVAARVVTASGALVPGHISHPVLG